MLDLTELLNIDALGISLASSEDIKNWSYGEVTKPETINYRSFKPERDGLFDERIFGPVQDFACACGKYKGHRYKGVRCDKCGVEVTHSRVRRERMGHIELAAPVVHVWYFKGIPSKIALLTGIAPKNLEAIIYFSSFIILEMDDAKKEEVLKKIDEEVAKVPARVEERIKAQIEEVKKQLEEDIKNIKAKNKEKKEKELRMKAGQKIKRLENKINKEIQKEEKEVLKTKNKIQSMEKYSVMADSEYYSMQDYIDEFARVGIGAEAIQEILEQIDLVKLAAKLKETISNSKGQILLKTTKRLRLVEGFRRANIKPSWMILSVLPVIPPDLRPMVQLDGGRFATSDLNDLYRRVINRNNRLKKLISIGAPAIITRNEKRMLQEAVDALIDASKSRRTNRLSRGSKQLKSLSDMIKGKQGRFRGNLLGKRVDYSGRAVIVVGPELKINECGLPKKMAVELYKPFILRELIVNGSAPNIKTARIMINDQDPRVFDVLEKVVKERPVLLNRAPTLHKLGIQGFYPKLIEGNAIRLHPLVCSGFNADFDGDQMAVHLPLSENSIREIKTTMMATNNFLKPAAGEFLALATRDLYLGTYYITKMESEKKPQEGKVYTKEEALYAHQLGELNIEEPIYLYDKKAKDQKIITSVGRIIFNNILPKGFPYLNEVIEKKRFKDLAIEIHEKYGQEETARFLDEAKKLGFGYATISGLSVSVTDVKMIKEREKIIAEAEKKITEIEQNYLMGLITEKELETLSNKVWLDATDKLDVLTWNNLPEDNPLKIMVTAGAGKASQAQVKQIAGMKGLVMDPSGKLVPLPIRSNYRIGLSGFEIFTAAKGARKGLTDKGLKTASAGYLSRRLVDVAQDVIVREQDCGIKEGRVITKEDNTALATYTERIVGRYPAKDIKDSKGKVIVKANELITKELAEKIEKAKIEEIEIRSPTTCKTKYGICAKCYGLDLSTQEEVKVGTAVGIIAAQAIGEPGTQLTMKTFHKGGIAGQDITMGLPRVEEIFEARTPKASAIISEITGKVSIEVDKETGKTTITVTALDKNADVQEVKYEVDPLAEVLVKDGQLVSIGDDLTNGHKNLNDLFSLVGKEQTQEYIINQIQSVYAFQGVLLDDKHVEVIVRQMFNKVIVTEIGDTDFVPNEILSVDRFTEVNEKVVAEGGIPAKAKIALLGISKSALNTDSFLSAASFQETTRVLADAATSGS
ncbi:MAG TPA: DNA-directed RNA polymerase subunit beta', partial [candidate division WWE3 bacterium]|nr:DNA-directed RNA polymerase subunit beta' [candidate division WWE3 bacterium]